MYIVLYSYIYIYMCMCVYIYIYMYLNYLVVSAPLLKNMSSSIGMMTFPIYGKNN